MTAWGPGSFQNQAAREWQFGLANNGIRAITRTLEKASAKKRCDTVLAQEALAAAEVVAAMMGRAAEDLPAEPAAYAEGAQAAPDLVDLARATVQGIFLDSELKDDWDATEGADGWEDSIGDLLDRLGQEIRA